jgi:hypothetical protein
VLNRAKFIRQEVLNRLQGNYLLQTPITARYHFRRPLGIAANAIEAPTALEGTSAKLGRLKGIEHQEFYLNYSGSEAFVQSTTTITKSRTNVQIPIQIWWASACQVPDLRKCLSKV